ncbi:sulfatase-like hydrolase/transferase [Methylocaldum sp. MU1018]
MKRRKFISSSLAAGALAGVNLIGKRSSAATPPNGPPNILFIHVDEMRFPTVFPSGINNVGEFLAKFMPNTHKLWRRGVKFANYYTASAACSPSRGVFTTGLYSQQNWVTQTIRNFPGLPGGALQPVLDPGFPTYGSLLKRAGYRTPYFGKWHISVPKAPEDGGDGLAAYGFDDMIYPDPTGANLQGTVGYEPDFHSDQYIANQAANWLSKRTAGESPWCLTVGFVNPHDKAWFWAGTEYKTYAALFPSGKFPPLVNWADEDLAKDISWGQNPLRDPPSFGYPPIPPNWESADQVKANKPSTQTFWRLFTAANWGGISDDPKQRKFTTARYPDVPAGKFSMAFAPYSYWQRGLDLYTQVMSQVDVHIGTVLDALPSAVADNTIIVFTADHGDYAGAHGFTSDKMGTCYQEIVNVPLIVADPTGQFAGDIDTVRDQLASSVDLVPMLVSLAHNGSRHWITRGLRGLYGRRHDMIPLLKSAHAPGRPYVLFTFDELAPRYNFNDSPPHVLGLITKNAKLGVYSRWQPQTTTIDQSSIELEFYDYATAGGRAETENTPDDPRVQKMLNRLLTDIIPNELQAPLPSPYGRAQTRARLKYLVYEGIANQLGVHDTGLVIGL